MMGKVTVSGRFQADRASVIRRYRAGESAEKLGDEYGITARWVRYLMREWGVERDLRGEHLKRVREKVTAEVLMKLLDRGLNYTQIGRELGVSVGTVNYYLRKFDLLGYAEEVRGEKGGDDYGWWLKAMR